MCLSLLGQYYIKFVRIPCLYSARVGVGYLKMGANMNDVMKKTFQRHSQLTLIFNPGDKCEVESFVYQFMALIRKQFQ
jgi:hypothetical protein